MNQEILILKNLLRTDIVEDYARAVFPYLKTEYFGGAEKSSFDIISEYFMKYNRFPTKEALQIEVQEKQNFSETEYANIMQVVDDIYIKDTIPDIKWLVDTTENFCQEKAIYNALTKSVAIAQGEDKKNDKNAIPDILSEALGVSFDSKIGHDYIDDCSDRWDFYNAKVNKIAFDLSMMNRATDGGFELKTLNVYVAPTGAGKSLVMCHHAADFLSTGKNVLYITLEMAEEKIAQRIDANLLNISMRDLKTIPKLLYQKKIEHVRSKTPGKLVIKEYPTASCHVGHFRHLIKELQIKKEFTPEIIIVDYINICASARMKSAENSYAFIKTIAEELRGLAQETVTCLITATQTNRGGYNNADLDLDNIAESSGLAATADWVGGIVVTDEMIELCQIKIKQLKSRYGDKNEYPGFFLGIDRPKMKLFDLEDERASMPLTQGDPKPMMDNSPPKKRIDFSDIKT